MPVGTTVKGVAVAPLPVDTKGMTESTAETIAAKIAIEIGGWTTENTEIAKKARKQLARRGTRSRNLPYQAYK